MLMTITILYSASFLLATKTCYSTFCVQGKLLLIGFHNCQNNIGTMLQHNSAFSIATAQLY